MDGQTVVFVFPDCYEDGSNTVLSFAESCNSVISYRDDMCG
jgi:hypothetical protein